MTRTLVEIWMKMSTRRKTSSIRGDATLNQSLIQQVPGIGMPQTYDNVLDYDKYVQNRPQPMTSTNIGLSSKTGKSLRSLNQTCDGEKGKLKVSECRMNLWGE